MNVVLIANILTLVAQGFSLTASTRKKKEEILIFQSIFLAIVSTSSCLLVDIVLLFLTLLVLLEIYLQLKRLTVIKSTIY